MSIYLPKELLEQHQVKLIYTRNLPCALYFEEVWQNSELDSLVTSWRDAQGNPFPERDLQPHRVGFRDLVDLGGPKAARCAPLSWARYMILSKAANREQIPGSENYKVLSLSCLVRTSDGKLVLSFRSKNVSHYAQMYHVSAAGYIDLEMARESRSALPQVFTEFEEEINVLPTHVRFVRQLGLCEHTVPDSAVAEILYLAEVKLTAGELLARAKDARDTWEGKVSAFSENEVRGMLTHERFNPAGAATLITAFHLQR